MVEEQAMVCEKDGSLVSFCHDSGEKSARYLWRVGMDDGDRAFRRIPLTGIPERLYHCFASAEVLGLRGFGVGRMYRRIKSRLIGGVLITGML